MLIMKVPAGILPLLCLDSYQVHWIATVHCTINDLGVEVIMIPPSCTGGLKQPIGVGYNKLFKNHVLIRECFDEQEPSSYNSCTWIIEAEKRICSNMLRNVWNWKGWWENFPSGGNANGGGEVMSVTGVVA